MIERRRDGTHWRHEMSRDHCEWVCAVMNGPMGKISFQEAVRAMDKAWAGLSARITSTQFDPGAYHRGVNPTFLLVDEYCTEAEANALRVAKKS